MIPTAVIEFDAVFTGPNQLDVSRDDVVADRDVLIEPAKGTISAAGFEANIDVCVRYVAAWLDGLGCVPINHLMEDAATAEISRVQLWQWLHNAGTKLDDGSFIDFAMFDRVLAGCKQRLPNRGLPGQDQIDTAITMLRDWTHADELLDFLTLPAYERLA